MKNCMYAAVIVVLAVVCALASGCATRPALKLDTVGPLSAGRTSILVEEQGALQVFSATETHDLGGITYFPHSAYSVYTMDGRRVKSVQNQASSADQQPMVVRLPAGKYLVYALAEGYGRVAVPIVIQGSRLTVLFLERSGMPEAASLPTAEQVRMPDGRVIGRRATE